jgi:hypothetical protein
MTMKRGGLVLDTHLITLYLTPAHIALLFALPPQSVDHQTLIDNVLPPVSSSLVKQPGNNQEYLGSDY